MFYWLYWLIAGIWAAMLLWLAWHFRHQTWLRRRALLTKLGAILVVSATWLLWLFTAIVVVVLGGFVLITLWAADIPEKPKE
jgi:hypothetical protein